MVLRDWAFLRFCDFTRSLYVFWTFQRIRWLTFELKAHAPSVRAAAASDCPVHGVAEEVPSHTALLRMRRRGRVSGACRRRREPPGPGAVCSFQGFTCSPGSEACRGRCPERGDRRGLLALRRRWPPGFLRSVAVPLRASVAHTRRGAGRHGLTRERAKPVPLGALSPPPGRRDPGVREATLFPGRQGPLLRCSVSPSCALLLLVSPSTAATETSIPATRTGAVPPTFPKLFVQC